MKPPNGLPLNLHREFFTQIANGTKRTEYRARSPYWRRRLARREYELIRFRNGYATRAPEMQVEYLGIRRTQRNGRACFAIRLGRVIGIKNWPTQKG